MKDKYTTREFLDDLNAQLQKVNITYAHLFHEEKSKQYLTLLNKLFRTALALKEDAQNKNQEEAANLFLGMQCHLNSLISLLEMWTFLKVSKIDEAWNKLIDAQEYAHISVLANGSTQTKELFLHLNKIEKFTFPIPKFVSAGFTYKAGKCSICSFKFNTCHHAEGSIYTGRVCKQIDLQNVKFEHVAFVEIPRDKRCRIIEIEKDGIYQNYFSGEEYKYEKSEIIDGLRCKAVAFKFWTLLYIN